VGVEPT